VAAIKPNRFSRFDEAEVAVCLWINRGAHRLPVRRFFSAISLLGNGIFWYALLALLPLAYGAEGILPTVHMGVVGLIGVVVYKGLKAKLVRERPFIASPDILCGSPPLDRYSFPSGHTLHAVSFSILVVEYFPELGWIVLPFAALVSMSRVLLGLHYPSDVVAGAAIGGTIASASLLVVA
jgi:undecaprenyl-diphosphatase